MRKRRIPETLDGEPQSEPVPTPRGLDYQQLGKAGQVQILRNRLAQIEAEHFSHLTNSKALEGVGQNTDEQKRAMVVLEAAHAFVLEQLVDLEA